MILRPVLYQNLFPSEYFGTIAVLTIGMSVSLFVAAEDEIAGEELPRSGVLELEVTVDSESTVTKSLARVLSKLEAVGKAKARSTDEIPLLVKINVNETTREFTNLEDATRVVEGVAEILDVARKLKIQLGELGRLEDTQTQSQQATQAQPPKQPFARVNARDGDDGYGIGGGLGGPGGGVGVANQQPFDLATLRRAGAGSRDAQIEMLRQQLGKLLAPPLASEQGDTGVAKTADPNEVELGKATLFARMVHRDYQKATFSFEFGLRDDPACLHANDWDLQYGNGGDHFHVTMVADDRSRIVDLGEIDWGQLDTKRLAKLPPHPQPRREFVPSAVGHVYLVHTVDRNSDLYALFRVEAVDQQQGTCDITWRLVDVAN